LSRNSIISTSVCLRYDDDMFGCDILLSYSIVVVKPVFVSNYSSKYVCLIEVCLTFSNLTKSWWEKKWEVGKSSRRIMNLVIQESWPSLVPGERLLVTVHVWMDGTCMGDRYMDWWPGRLLTTATYVGFNLQYMMESFRRPFMWVVFGDP